MTACDCGETGAHRCALGRERFAAIARGMAEARCSCGCHAWSGPFRQTCRGCGHGPDTSTGDPAEVTIAPWIAARRDLTDAQKLRMQAAWDRAQAESEGR